MLAVRFSHMGPFSFVQDFGDEVAELIERSPNYAAYRVIKAGLLIEFDVTIHDDRKSVPAKSRIRDLIHLGDSVFAVVHRGNSEPFRGEVSSKVVAYPPIDPKRKAFQVIDGGLSRSKDRCNG